jgi:hypothetical protein
MLMNRRSLLSQGFSLTSVALATSAGLAGCFGPLKASLEWEEDVLLSSGETIRVARDIKFKRGAAFGGSPVGPAEWDRAVLRSLASPPLFPEWNAPLFAICLDRDSAGDWCVVAATDSLTFWALNGQPATGQWAFRVKGSRWILRPIPPEFLGRRRNLLVTYDANDTDRTIKREISVRKQKPGPEYLETVRSTRYRAFEGSSPTAMPLHELQEFEE